MTNVPDFLPVLSSGSHTSPREGACAMEYVSILAGEPFSDQPKCTLPAFASLTIRLNDSVTDADRQRLVAPLIPRLFSTNTDDPYVLTAVSIAMLRVLERRYWSRYGWWPAAVSRELGKARDILDRWARGEYVSLDELTATAATAAAMAAATAYWLDTSVMHEVLVAGLDAFDEVAGREGANDLDVQTWQRLSDAVGVH